jgi:hypothetical protein
MISINGRKIDLVFQVEEYSSITDIIKELTLDIDDILIICPELFIQRFIHSMHDNISEAELEGLEDDLNNNVRSTGFDMLYKGKYFIIHFIITTTDLKFVETPFGDKKEYKVAFNKITI